MNVAFIIFWFVCIQLNHWFDELKKELQSSEVADTIERSEELLFQFDQQREATINACVNTIREGENLVEQLRYDT